MSTADLPPLPLSPPKETFLFDNPAQYPSNDSHQVAARDTKTPRDNTLLFSPIHLPPKVHQGSSSRLHSPHRQQNRSPHPSCGHGSERTGQRTTTPHSQAADFYGPSVQKQIQSCGRWQVQPMFDSALQQPLHSGSRFAERFDDVALQSTPAGAENGPGGDRSSRPTTKGSSHFTNESKVFGRSWRTLGGHYQKREFQLYDPEAAPRLLSRGWKSVPGEHTRKARIVFMGVGVVGVTGLVLVGLACSGVL